MSTGPAAQGRLRTRVDGATARPAPVPGVHPLHEVGLADHLLVVPAGTSWPAPLLVFFHGAGGRAAGSLSLVGDVAARHGALLLLPSSRASTWDLITGRLGEDVADLDTALEHVVSTCEVSRVAFGGFSDGASYALSIGLANGDLLDAVLAFSPGFLAPPVLVGRPRTWVSHGTSDTVLPVDSCGRRVVHGLRAADHDVRYEEFDGGHVVPPEQTSAAFSWWLGGA